jgi:hypothetical protein
MLTTTDSTVISNSSRLLLTAPHSYAPQLRCATAAAAIAVAAASIAAAITAASLLWYWRCDMIHPYSAVIHQCNRSMQTI